MISNPFASECFNRRERRERRGRLEREMTNSDEERILSHPFASECFNRRERRERRGR
jgi:hypothetical protein